MFNRGLAYYELGLYDLAIEDYSFIIQEDSTDFEALYNRGLAYYEMAAYQKAATDFSKVLEANPDYNKAHTLLGLCHYHFGNFAKAIEFFNKAKETDNLSPSNYYNRALAYQAMREYAKAKNDYLTAIELEPKALYYWGLADLMHEMRNFEASVEFYNVALGLDSFETRLYFNRGVSYFEMKNYNSAIDDFNKVLEFNENDIDALWYLTMSFQKKGDYSTALHYYEQVETMQPLYEYLWAINKSELIIKDFFSKNYYYLVLIILLIALAVFIVAKMMKAENRQNLLSEV
jgi:tetratricopeptide (TPR) repeat protein